VTELELTVMQVILSGHLRIARNAIIINSFLINRRKNALTAIHSKVSNVMKTTISAMFTI
jgi:hypothetical protein